MTNTPVPVCAEQECASLSPDLRDLDEADVRSIAERLDAGSKRMKAIEAQLAEQSQKIAENTSLTRDIRDLMEMARAGFRVLGVMGTAARWIGVIAAAGVSVWTLIQTIKSGHPPSK
jgi:peptidoglycan hydrolase CwlO-like protein